MKSILRATAILGSSSILTILIGLVSAKAWAVLLGPSGLGLLGLLQSLIGLAGLIAGLGIGAGLVRSGSNALANDDQQRAAALRQAGWLVQLVCALLAMLVLVLLRGPLSQWLLGDTTYDWAVVLMAPALMLNLVSGMQTSILNMHQRVSALAKISVVNSVLGTAAAILIVWQWREQGIAPAIIVSSVVGLAITSWFLVREPAHVHARPSRRRVLHEAWGLLRFGMPYTGSMLVGTGVQFALPALALHTLGLDSVGFYRAAVSISSGYLGFLLTAMAYDYFPRISAASDKPAELIHIVNQQHRLVMLLGIPLILSTLAVAPYLVPLIYSPEFSPAISVLEWHLLGDLLKFSSWTMGFVILARSGSVVVFVVELVFGTAVLTASWLGMQLFGLPGLGIGFLCSYAIHYLVVWSIVRRDIGLTLTLGNRLMLSVALLSVALVLAAPAIGLAHLRTPLALLFALLAGLFSLKSIWHEVGGLNVVRAWRHSA
jgi:PST family polysaccharide transporter